MKIFELAQSNRRLRPVRLGVTVGLAMLFLAALLWGLQGVTPAHADPGILYVDGTTGSDTTGCTDPAAPCETIGYALNEAGNGDEIRVAVGTYMETLDIHITVTLKGGYTMSGTLWLPPGSGETIVDANSADDPVISITSGANVTVEGFTVQGANHTSDAGGGFAINGATVVISDTVVRNNSAQNGGGISAEGDTNVSLINSTFTANAADGGASGLAGGVLGYVVIQNTVFAENTGDCVLEFESGQPFEIIGGQVVSNTVSGWRAIGINSSGTISGTAVLSNTSTGIGVQPNGIVSAQNLTLRGNAGGIANSGVLTITNSVIENNSGGGSSVVSSENSAETNRLIMDGCTIRGNSTPGAVRITTGYAEIRNTKIVDHVVTDPHVAIVIIGEAGTTPTVELVNVLLADNESEQPVVDVTSETGSAMLMNVTVTGNQISGNPILHTHGAMTLTNIIVWGNTTSGDMLGGPGTLLVSYSDIKGGWTGTGNLDADPLFVDAANGDYHLGVGSPCVDKGTLIGAPTHDIEGTPRAAAPDMGAYEWTGFRIFLPLALRNS